MGDRDWGACSRGPNYNHRKNPEGANPHQQGEGAAAGAAADAQGEGTGGSAPRGAPRARSPLLVRV